MILTHDDILQALSAVQEPDLKKDLVTLNMIRDIKTGIHQIGFTVVLTTPACPLKETIRQDCIRAVRTFAHDDALDVQINFTADVTTNRLPDTPLLPGVKNIIAIASGKGGVGKSTVTANLAMALHRLGAKVGIIDADISGPSIPTMFDVETMQPQIVQRELNTLSGEKELKNYLVPIRQYGIRLMSIGFLTPPDSAVVWRGPMASSALRQFITDTEWGELDYLLIDLPPGTGDIHLTLVKTVPLTGVLLVTTPQKVAVADALRALLMFREPQIGVPVLGVVENMAYFTPEELPENKYYLFGQGGGNRLASAYEVPFLGEIPLVQGIREAGDSGKPAVMNDPVTALAFEKLAQGLAQQISVRNAHLETVAY